jgi:8-hydroxy-5-deazaflavin:NADPH oxidoreductase
MQVAILGTGTMGMALGRLFGRAGHAIVFGSRSPERGRTAAAALGASAMGGGCREAVERAGLVALAALWEDVPGILERSGPWSGRILLDCSNPERSDGRGLAIGHTTSGAEEIARRAPGARVVKALNHVYAEVLDALEPGEPGPTAFYCGDDPDAKAAVAAVLAGAGLRGLDAGPLASARYLEPLAALMVELVRGRGLDPRRTALRMPAETMAVESRN